MDCPGCGRPELELRQRLFVAARRQVTCPACGAAIRFGFWPRVVHTVFGDALLLGGIAGALFFQAPFLVPLSSGSWLILALLLPIEARPRP